MTNFLDIYWLVNGVLPQSGGWTSQLASSRYRAIIPAQALADKGHRVQIKDLHHWHWQAEESSSVFVVGKLLPGSDSTQFGILSETILNSTKAANAAGRLIVADFVDDHFDHSLAGYYWRQLAQMAGLCVAGSDAMAQRVRQFTSRPIVVIGDPLGSPGAPPRVSKAESALAKWARQLLAPRSVERLTMVWYGNTMNWPPLIDWAQQLAEGLVKERPFVIWIVTQPDERLVSAVAQFNKRYGLQGMLEIVPWELETYWQVVADASIVLIPADLRDEKKTVKTSNRLTDALNMGRFVIASPVPSYEPYAEYVSLTDDPVGAVKKYLACPDEALSQLISGQAAARARCHASVIGLEWLRAFQSQGGGELARPSAAQPKPNIVFDHHKVRLNLGCGDKILQGYVNVDMVESRAGKAPDVICDLHQLTTFGDNYADEILAVHVVEHFWRWEIEAILREWLRVLKPGGRMVLECPNLKSACEAFLADPELRSRPDQEGQTTMWVFYGDPKWKDPLMVHRWGYTPESLAGLMRSVGLSGVQQEPAEFKLREPRDMRVVGYK